jgi:hypothetical protein
MKLFLHQIFEKKKSFQNIAETALYPDLQYLMFEITVFKILTQLQTN